MIDLLGVAIYMREAHRGHPPRMGGEPYETHPWDVLSIHRFVFGRASPVVEAAILLHDVDEDHRDEGYNLADIRVRFGDDVAVLVDWVTKPQRDFLVNKEDFNRLCYEKLGKKGPDDAVRIKVADRLANIADPERWRPAFRTRYIADTLNLIQSLDGRPGVEHLRQRIDVIRET